MIWFAMAAHSSLKPITRLITTHDASGKAVFSTQMSNQPEQKAIDRGAAFFALSYCSEEFPVDMSEDKDVKAYQKHLIEAPGLVIGSGSVLRHVDMAPANTSPMHRTQSLDYGIMIEGEVELVLDSGETRRMLPGDIAIQRGTMHAWRNPSSDRWARMLFVLLPSKPVTVRGRCFGEDLEGMEGVRASS